MRVQVAKVIIASMALATLAAAPAVSLEIPNEPLVSFTVGQGGRPLLAPMTLNGQSLLFLIDTGAARTVVDSALQTHLGPACGGTTVRTPAGLIRVCLFRCPPLSRPIGVGSS